MKYRYGIITDFTVDKTKETITVHFIAGTKKSRNDSAG